MSFWLRRISILFLSSKQVFRPLGPIRPFSTEKYTDGEKKIVDILKGKFPAAAHIEVADISGGCGAMYEIFIESEDFRGKNTLTQHRLVNKALADEILEMHGLRISTRAPTEP